MKRVFTFSEIPNNNTDNGRCTATCALAICGDGLVFLEQEECDDGNGGNSDSCPDGVGGTCAVATCGDGHTWSTDGGTETCDDGDGDNSDSCPDGVDGTCVAATCGDGHTWSTDGGTET